MNIIKITDLLYKYIRRDENDRVLEESCALKNLNIEIEEGSFTCVLGHNGSGKSTLAKLINGLNIPTDGTVIVDGKDTSDENEIWNIRKEAGMVFQNPDNQIIASVVEEDVGFGPENIGVPSKEIWQRVDNCLDATGLQAQRHKSPNRLSGGQKQRCAIAGTMAMFPKCIIFDEPTAMLDPSGRAEVLETIKMLNREMKVTIILITHYMEETVDADRIIVMDKGSIVMDGKPLEIFKDVEKLRSYRMDVPLYKELTYELEKKGLDIKNDILRKDELARELSKHIEKGVYDLRIKREDSNIQAETVMKVKGISHIYQKGTIMQTYAVKDVSFNLNKGEVLAIIGHTGSGKSTLIQHLNGLLKADEGSIEIISEDRSSFINIYDSSFKMKDLRFRVGLVFQYPEYQLFEETVLKDVMFGPLNKGMSNEEALNKAKEAIKLSGLSEDLWEKSPFELSGGQKRRVAIAGILAMEPEILILDEPTAGLDPAGRDELFKVIDKLGKEKNISIVLVSHSMDDVAEYADRVIVIDHGVLKFEGKPMEVFSNISELEEMGLGVPQINYLVKELEGYEVILKNVPDNKTEFIKALMGILKEERLCLEK